MRDCFNDVPRVFEHNGSLADGLRAAADLVDENSEDYAQVVTQLNPEEPGNFLVTVYLH